jgi:hypothetical protein
LHLFPSVDVIKAFDLMTSDFDDDVNAFLDYFEETRINASSGTRGKLIN